MKDTVWMTRDGRAILVSNMGRRHILNCIAKIERSKRGWRREYLERLKLELTIRDITGRSY